MRLERAKSKPVRPAWPSCQNDRGLRQTGGGQRAEGGGFTIVELLIATAVFSVVLLLCATATVQVGKTFYKGVTINRVQDTARKVAEDVTQAVQLSSGDLRIGSGTFGSGPGTVDAKSICIGTVRYSYVLDRSLGTVVANQALHIMWKDRLPVSVACDPVNLTQNAPSAGGQELLGPNMRIPVFDVQQPLATSLSWPISIVISYGDAPDLFETGSNFSRCISQRLGGQFCAVSTINTSATKRL